MPFVEISIATGRSPEKIGELIRSVTETISIWDDIDPDEISVMVTEVAKDHWGKGGVTIAARNSPKMVPLDELAEAEPETLDQQARIE